MSAHAAIAEIEQTRASNRILLKAINGDPEELGTAISVRAYLDRCF
jgi:hypothetical protein